MSASGLLSGIHYVKERNN